MKLHIGVDSQSGLAHSAVVTAANVHDKHPLPDLLHGNERRIYGDSAYASQKDLIRGKAPNALDFTNQRTRKAGGEVDEVKKAKNRNKSRIRARVEHVFSVAGVQRQCWRDYPLSQADACSDERSQAAPRLQVKLQSVSVRTDADVTAALEMLGRERPDALLVYPDFVTGRNRSRILEFAAKHRLPAMYGFREWVDAGGLMSFGSNLQEQSYRTAFAIDKILKGADPATMPIEQPTRFELVVNLMTARAIGLAIPVAYWCKPM